MSGSSAPPKGCLFAEPLNKPLVNGAPLQLGYRYFYVTGTLVQATVYQDGYLTTPFVQPVTADINGRFPAIYLDPSVVYKSVLYNNSNVPQETADPVVQQPPSLAASALSVFVQTSSSSVTPTGLSVNTTQAGVYAYEAYLELVDVSGASTAGIEIVPGTINTSAANLATFVGSDNTPGSFQVSTLTAFNLNVSGVTGIWVRGVVSVLAAGAFSISWSNNGAGTVRLNAGSFLLLQPILNTGIIFREPQDKPLAAAGSLTQTQPGVYRLFFYSGTSILAPVYADAGLTRPLSQVSGQQQPSCTADGNGRISVIYLDPSITYGTRLFNAAGTPLQPLVDPYVPRAFEPITAVKTAPSVRLSGISIAPDSALQITLNPGVYAIDAMLEFVPSAGSLTAGVKLAVISGMGIVSAPSGVASSAAYEGSGGVSGAYNIGSQLNFALSSAQSANILYSRGSVTIINAPVTFGLLWTASGTAGTAVSLNAGSFLQAVQVG